MFEKKRLWNNDLIECVKIDGRWYALDGWNGEKWLDCWEVDERTFTVCQDDKNEYEIRPVYRFETDVRYEDIPEDIPAELDDFLSEVVGYEVR